MNGLYKTEVIEYLKADWQGLEDVQLATLNWVIENKRIPIPEHVELLTGKKRLLGGPIL